MSGSWLTPGFLRRFGAFIMMVNLTVAFFSVTDMYLLASGAIQVDPPEEDGFITGYDPVAMDLVFRGEYRVTNRGFYDVEDLDIRSWLYTEDGRLLIDYSSKDRTVDRWSTREFGIEARLPLERMLSLDLEAMMFEDSDFRLKVRIGADYVMGLVHFQLDQGRTFPWEGPLKDVEDLLRDGDLRRRVEGALEGYGIEVEMIDAALYGAFMTPGEEVRVPLEGPFVLAMDVEEDRLEVRVNMTAPAEVTLIEAGFGLEDNTGGEAG